jgi:hypothetical protein
VGAHFEAITVSELDGEMYIVEDVFFYFLLSCVNQSIIP